MLPSVQRTQGQYSQFEDNICSCRANCSLSFPSRHPEDHWPMLCETTLVLILSYFNRTSLAESLI